MTVELTYLFWSAVLAFFQVGLAAIGTILVAGLARAAASRDNFPTEFPGWAGRARRAHANMLESLLLFAILVIVAHLAGRTNDATALGAQIFFFARLAYVVVYIIGTPWLRTLVWAVSVIGMVMIALQLI